MEPTLHVSHAAAVAIMMNNYLHDIATALLGATGIALRMMLRRYEATTGSAEVREFFGAVYAGLRKLARVSLYWILLGGIPRTLFYRGFEWSDAVMHKQVPALLVKHALLFCFVAYGALTWRKYNSRARGLLGLG